VVSDSVSKKLNEVEGEEHYQIPVSNRFPALENLDGMNTNRIFRQREPRLLRNEEI
jgi:hypothetical protein